ncbi:MAG: Gfo/Idh/MocA family oxidoreductase [Bacteroidales bacterium]|nr:Gfo/Idh/MocA family oxidoreductase [Bacteroidales bacterium]
MSNEISRRTFLKAGTAAAIGLTMAPDSMLGKSKKKTVAPSDKLNIIGVGIGGRGASDLRGMESQNIIALCDTDWAYAKHVFERYPEAKRYNDWRVCYDEMLKDADAVMVATADHTHAIIAANAITEGKHVYVEKPLTHTVYESRLLTKLAAKYKVATQMGNQGASNEGVRQTCSWIWNGVIGEVTKVEAFTDRPIWPQGLDRPEKEDPIPDTLNWDGFIGPAQYRPYNSIYTPWNFRGWWDFGTGALGDMACHILHPVFKALKLGYPTRVQGSSTALLTESCPNAQIVKLVFPARENLPKVAMPEVEVWWYDGGLKPPRPAGLPAGKNLNVQGGGVIFHGTKDTLICGCYGAKPYLLSGRNPETPEVLRVITEGHQMDWVRACKEDAANRVLTASDFSEAGPFNEMVVMGVLAVRLQSLNRELEWDGPNMRFTNIPEGATIKTMIHDGFSVTDGHPTFKKTYTDPVDANAYAAELIKHTYRDGWTLPDMPE